MNLVKNTISEKIKNLPIFDQENAFLFIEIISNFIRVTLVRILPGKGIEIAKSKIISNDISQYSISIDNLKTLVKEFPSHYNVVISLDYRLVTTAQSGASVIRDQLNVPITEVDLDNLISKALWKAFSKQRKRASKKMEISDVQSSLFNANILQVKLDGNRVMNPLDFSARSVEIWIQQDIVNKRVFSDLIKIFPEENILSLEEAPGVVAGLISLQKEQNKVLFVSVASEKTVIYEIERLTLKYLDVISWGTDLVTKIICGTFGVDRGVANKMLDLHSKKEVSRSVIKKINDILSGEFAILLKGIESYSKDRKIKDAYIHSFYKLPEFVFSKRFRAKLKTSTQCTDVNLDFIGKNFNFDLKLTQGQDDESLPSFTHLLSSYIRNNKQKENEILSKIAKRRARWLRNQ